MKWDAGRDRVSGMRDRIGRIVLRVALATILLLVMGCSVGPKYVRPPVQSPPAYKELPQAGREWIGCLADGSAERWHNPREVVGGIQRSAIERTGREGEFFEPRNRSGGGQLSRSAGSGSRSSLAIFPDRDRQSEHHQFTPVAGAVRRRADGKLLGSRIDRQIVHRLFVAF